MKITIFLTVILYSAISLSQDYEGEDLAQQIEDEIATYEGDYSSEFQTSYSDDRDGVSEDIERQENDVIYDEDITEEL